MHYLPPKCGGEFPTTKVFIFLIFINKQKYIRNFHMKLRFFQS